MLLNNKKFTREKLKLNFCDYKEHDIIDETETDEPDYIYNTNNIILDKLISSNIEYNGIPSKTSIKNAIKNNKKYMYNCFNKNEIPINKVNCKIMIYNINKQCEIPFLLYLLKYNDIENKYSYIDIDKAVESNIEKYISNELNLNIQYCGYIIYNNIYYLFFESIDINMLSYQYSKKYTWALVSEIVNYKYIYNIEIDNTISNLFLKHVELLNIKHIDNTIYESPVVGYSINIDGNIYFNSDYNIILHVINNEKNVDRYAVFLGVIKINNNDLINNYSIDTSHKYNSIYSSFDSKTYKLNYLINVKNDTQYILLTSFKK